MGKGLVAPWNKKLDDKRSYCAFERSDAIVLLKDLMMDRIKKTDGGKKRGYITVRSYRIIEIPSTPSLPHIRAATFPTYASPDWEQEANAGKQPWLPKQGPCSSSRTFQMLGPLVAGRPSQHALINPHGTCLGQQCGDPVCSVVPLSSHECTSCLPSFATHSAGSHESPGPTAELPT